MKFFPLNQPSKTPQTKFFSRRLPVPIVRPVRPGWRRSRVGERPRLYAASLVLMLAEALLKLALPLFQSGVLDRHGVRLLMRVSEWLRRLSWKLWR